MKLPAHSPAAFDLERSIASDVQGDYIYMYPPRQAYRVIQPQVLRTAIEESIDETSSEPVNLYLHFPFCRQICRFCNLYAVPAKNSSMFEQYISLLLDETAQWAEKLAHRRVDTIYFGGGTPSLFTAQQLDRVLSRVEQLWATRRESVPEISLEVAPDTVDATRLTEFRDIGINRINLGLQATSDAQLRQIGRRHGYALARETIAEALTCGFENVCVDLIYGLPNQSIADWCDAVEEVASLGPQTVCAYPLTLRPNTGFARLGLEIDGADQYKKYDYACNALAGHGYAQETHVRYTKPAVGGYRQKVNHWAGQDIVGMGAGARGYLSRVDYRNSYSIVRRRDALNAYLNRVSSRSLAYDSGILLDDYERIRRAVILGLLRINRDEFARRFGADPIRAFPEQFSTLTDLGLAKVTDKEITLTSHGRKYRDLAVLTFFSLRVWKLVSTFDYHE